MFSIIKHPYHRVREMQKRELNVKVVSKRNINYKCQRGLGLTFEAAVRLLVCVMIVLRNARRLND